MREALISAGQLEHVLCGIHGDQRSIHIGLLLFFSRLETEFTVALRCRKRKAGGVHFITRSDANYAALRLHRTAR